MLRRRAAFALFLSLLVPAVAWGDDALDALKKKYAELEPADREIRTFLDGVQKEEHAIMAVMAEARKAEEEAAQNPSDAALKAHADELSQRARAEAEGHDKRIPGYRKLLGAHQQKLQALFREIEAARKKAPNDDALLIFRSKFLAERGVMSEVRDDVAKLFEKHADDRDVRFLYGESLLVVPVSGNRPNQARPPQFEKAIEVLEPLAKAEPTNPDVQLLYGVAASAVDKNAEAKAAFDTIAAITSCRSDVRNLIGNAQDPDEAFAVWRDAAEGLLKNPDDAALRAKRAELLLSVDASLRAIADAELALKAKPDDTSTKKLLARAYSRAKRFDAAAPLYDALAAEMDKDAELRAEHAIFLYNSQKPADSIAELLKIKDSSKFEPRLHELLRSMLNDMKKTMKEDPRVEAYVLKSAADAGAFTQIWDDAEKAWAKLPDDPILRFTYAETLMCVPLPEHEDPRMRGPEPRAPNFDKVYELLTPLVASQPDDMDVRLLHAVAACAIGKDAEAKKSFEAIASIGSVRPVVRTLLGSAKEPIPEYVKWRDLAIGLADHPDDADLRVKRAELLLGCDAAAYALKDVEAVLQTKPEDPKVRSIAGRAYCAVNHYEKALTALGDTPPDDAAGEYGASLFGAGRFADFKAFWEKTKDKAAISKHLVPAVAQMLRTQPAQLDGLTQLWADEQKARAEDAKKDDNPRVQLETSRGLIVLELFEDTAPNTVANFISLVESGFYNNIKFHRIIPGFMAQGGDPTGTGGGSCGYNIKDELKDNPRFHWRGTLSMANTGAANSGNSQFFLCYGACPHLNAAEAQGRWRGHTVFGRIIEGQEVADVLLRGDAIVKATVLRKRSHDYKPETMVAPQRIPSRPVAPHGPVPVPAPGPTSPGSNQPPGGK
jgi:peptidyl-prolyl cis-trans isomerase B (cyclophilin B)